MKGLLAASIETDSLLAVKHLDRSVIAREGMFSVSPGGRPAGGSVGDVGEVEALTHEWALTMRASGRALSTIRHRLEVLDLYERRVGCDIIRCDWQTPAEFLATAPSAGTRWNYHQVLKVWYRWLCERRKLIESNPMDMLDNPKMPRRSPKPYTSDEVQRILSVGMYSRTRAMILLGLLQGMRAGEIARMHGRMVEGSFLRIIGKGEVERIIPIHPQIACELVPKYPANDWWFPAPSNRSKPMTSKSVSNVLGKVVRRAGIEGGAHRFRHWFGTESLESGNLREAQELLGHANVSTTEGYTKVRQEHLVRIVQALELPDHKRVSRRSLSASLTEY